MAILTRLIELVPKIEHLIGVYLVNRIQHELRGVVKTVRILYPARPVGIHQRFDFFGAFLDSLILRFFPGLCDGAARHLKKVGGFEERDRVVPGLLPVVVCPWSSVHHPLGAGLSRNRIPEPVGVVVHFGIHEVLDCGGQPVLRFA